MGSPRAYDQRACRSHAASSLASSAPTSAPSGYPNSRFLVAVSSATLLVPTRLSVCCIDRLNPPLVAVSRSRASTDRLHCKRKLRRGKRMQIESARARSAPDPLAGRRYRSLRLISSDGLRSAAEFNPREASVHHFGKESQRRSTEKCAGAPSAIETHQAGEKSRSDGHPFRQCIAGILLGIKQHHASLGDLRVSVPDRVGWRSE